MSASPRLKKSGLKRLQPQARLQPPPKTFQQELGSVQNIRMKFESDCVRASMTRSPKSALLCLANSNNNTLSPPNPNHTEQCSVPPVQQMAVTDHQLLGDWPHRAAWPTTSGTDGHMTAGRNSAPIGEGEEKVGPNLENLTT